MNDIVYNEFINKFNNRTIATIALENISFELRKEILDEAEKVSERENTHLEHREFLKELEYWRNLE